MKKEKLTAKALIEKLKMVEPDTPVMVHMQENYNDTIKEPEAVFLVRVEENHEGKKYFKSFDHKQNTIVITGGYI